MRHLSDDAFADALERRGDPRSLEHLRECDTCAARLAEAEAGLGAARRDVVPEPSPLYWDALRRNVARRIAEEPRASRPFAWLAPIAAAAALAAVVLGRGPLRTVPPVPLASPAAAASLPVWSALPPLEEDEAVPVLEGVLATPAGAGWDEGRGADAYVAGLSDDESTALAAALTAARRGKGEAL